MFNNLINWRDFGLLVSSLRTGSILRRLKCLLGERDCAVKLAWEQLKRPSASFWDIPSVRQRINYLITGDPDLNYAVQVSRTYLSALQPLYGLSLGCGNGHKNIWWVEQCRYARLDAYDISTSRVAYARSRAAATGHAEIRYYVADVSQVDWPSARYDVVFCEHALHHFTPLEPLLIQVAHTLQRGGYMVVDEFVGPSRFQWTERQLELINHTLGMLPRRYRRYWKDGKVKTSVHRPSRLSMMIGDPSEAVESSCILPLVERHFEVIERRDYGCTILAMLFDGIAQNFLGEDGKIKDDEARDLIELCFHIEDTMLRLGEIQNDFTFLVCKRR